MMIGNLKYKYNTVITSILKYNSEAVQNMQVKNLYSQNVSISGTKTNNH